MSFCISKITGIVDDIIQGLENARWIIRNIEKYTVYYKNQGGRQYPCKRTGRGQNRHDFTIRDRDLYRVQVDAFKRIQAEKDLAINWDRILSFYQKFCIRLNQEYKYITSKYQGVPHPSNNPFKPEHLIHRTARGEFVRSKSEVIIANALHAAKIDYYYEFPYITEEGNGRIYYPDFTIPVSIRGQTIYWEHCGYIKDAEYARNWIQKKIKLQEEGIFENVNLIVTYDSYYGEIDSFVIQNMIQKWFLPPDNKGLVPHSG